MSTFLNSFNKPKGALEVNTYEMWTITRHYTKDTHHNPVAKIRGILYVNCRVVQMQFKQTNGKWE